MVSIRSDDIRGRWGRLIDNTAAFTSLDLSGQSSGIIAVISGQTIPSSVSGQISGFSIGPTEIIAAVTNSAMLFSFSASGGSQSFRFTPANSSGALNISIMDRSGDERLFIQRAATQYNITAQRMTTSGAIKPIVFQMLETPAGTTIEPMRLTTSGDVEFNRSGGTVLFDRGILIGADASGISFSGLQHLPIRGSEKYTIYTEGGSFKARNDNTGIIDFSGTVIEVVVNNSLQSGGDVYVQEGIYPLTNSGVTLVSGCKLTMSTRTKILVPINFSGVIYTLSGIARAVLEGGITFVSGVGGDPTTNRYWTGVELVGSVRGCDHNVIRDMDIEYPKTGIAIRTNISGWCNGNLAQNMLIYGPNIIVDWDVSGFTPSLVGPNRNTFIQINGQGGAAMSHGYRNIIGKDNIFISCKAWDQVSGQISANIVSGGDGTTIIGGIMTTFGFTDLGSGTVRWDETNGLNSLASFTLAGQDFFMTNPIPRIHISGTTTLDFKQDSSGVAMPLYITGGAGSGSSINSSISLWPNSAQDRRMFIQRTMTQTIINSLRQTAGGTNAPVVFQIQDVIDGTTIEPMRLDTSGNVEFNRSGGNVIFNSGHTMGLSGVAPVSFTSGRMVLSGLNWTGVFTSGGVSGGSGTSFSGMIPQGYINLQVSGSNVKIPFFN